METGTIPLSTVSGGIDLRATLESGQSFLWNRTDGEMYAESPDDAWYYTVSNGEVIFVRKQSDRLEWRATTDAAAVLRRRFRLEDDLDEIFDSFPEDSTLERARGRYPGLRVVRDPFFPCLISFICSARTTVEQIHRFQIELAREFGKPIDVDGTTYYTYPRPAQLAAAPEARLRDLGLGFRAPYVKQTASMVASSEVTAATLRGEAYESAHDRLQSFTGVGPKVADCVALFALDHLEAVPVDRWTRRLIETYFPDLAQETYGETADTFREHFGQYAGYAQTYLYHYERS